MKENPEQKEKTDLLSDASELPALKGAEIFKFGQLENENLEKISGIELPQSRTTDFIDSKDRPITVKEWNTGKFTWIRAYDTNQAQVPETPNLGQAGLTNLALETGNSGEKKMRLGDIMIPDAYRGSGIAKKMLDQSISVAKERNANQIYGVIEDEKARGFWEHMQQYGWKIDDQGSEKGAYGHVYFDITKAGRLEKEHVPAFAQSDGKEIAPTLNKLDISALELQNSTIGSPIEKKPENDESLPFLSDRVKKVLVGISILATLTSSGISLEEYQRTHTNVPEIHNEIVIENPKQDSAFGTLIEDKSAQYHIAEPPTLKVSPSAVLEKTATLAAEIIEKQPVKEAQDVNAKPENATYWYDVPEYRQPDGRSCTPTSVSMVMGYWHQVDSKYDVASPKDLLNENIKEGVVSPAGMSLTNLDDEIKALNYQSNTVVDGTREELEAALAKGPVIALVKYSGKELAPHGVNHAVVVSGMTENDQVRVTDPMVGKSRLYTWAQFDAAWGANWGTNDTRYFSSIRPAELGTE